MHNLSMTQALSLWSDLETARLGKNGFGRDTAEIYLYRLMPYSPLLDVSKIDEPDSLTGAETRDAFIRANASLRHLLEHFGRTYEKEIRVLVEGREFGPWLARELYTHRVHVRIVSSKKKRV